MTYKLDAQDLLKMFLHTGVTLIFVAFSVSFTMYEVNFRGANGEVVPIGVMDSDKCTGNCGMKDTTVSALETAMVFQWLAQTL